MGYQTVNFHILVVPLNNTLFLFANSGYIYTFLYIYSAVFTPHVYFIIITKKSLKIPKGQSESVY